MDRSKHTHLRPDELSGEVIVDVGGFLGFGAKPAALRMFVPTFMRDENGTVHATTVMAKKS